MTMGENPEDIIYVTPKTSIHAFKTLIADRQVSFEVIKFNETLYLWIGEKDRQFSELAFAIQSKFSGDPVSTRIFGQISSTTSNALAASLSKKLNKPVYVSFNLVEDRLILPEVNKRLSEEIHKHPKCF